ncbi:ImmA/IrrE family metallo-endopeptidase [Arthrobacter sp. AET 35A]|uniref:ImmA/IrrE family metallo-endopeptidase n=1 Tax=Arthrobacter sp. AET 35A TaxID=2292643 RepID=UPI0017801214|nr:ImmA/IrrE family metallo-endopeptidase [Arthrobacter sp. AET 35A]MBE0011739.1 ImmA/IrrE family metallo-endopeptidase [Arthrobacter sp. AET 35A]
MATTFRVPVAPSLVEWAVHRSGKTYDELVHRFPELPAWQSGRSDPTFHQLEDFSHSTYTPFGFFFLQEAPRDELPIPDFRTVGSSPITEPSTDLLETIFICEQRQEWYRNYALAIGGEPLDFVGKANTSTPVVDAAQEIRAALKFTMADRASDPNWSAALRRLIDSAEQLGALVMISGIVGNNTHRSLDPQEFRGFALSDPFAPLIFVNGADTKAAQIFTLVHEVAHLWLGATALSDAALDRTTNNETETWCNMVAAEVLVPIASLRETYLGAPTTEEFDRLARYYKASTLVVLRRIFDAGRLTWDQFQLMYDQELSRVMALLKRSGEGGNFYYTHPLRVSRRFARALIRDTNAGRTLHRDAFQLLGTRKYKTFVNLGNQIGAV